MGAKCSLVLADFFQSAYSILSLLLLGPIKKTQHRYYLPLTDEDAEAKKGLVWITDQVGVLRKSTVSSSSSFSTRQQENLQIGSW